MSRVVKRIEKFSFYNNQAIVSHLEAMALMGYKLIHIEKSVWTYKIIKPREIKFRITYFEDQSLIFHDNPYNKRTIEEFFGYCKNVGWVLAGQWGKMQIFYTATDEYHEIETDYQKEFIALKTLMQRKSVPAMLAMSGLAIFQGVYQLIQFVNYPIKNLSNPAFVILSLIWIILFFAGLFGTSSYSSWKTKGEKSIKKTGTYPAIGTIKDTKYKISIMLVITAILLFIGLVLMIVFGFSQGFAIFYTSQIIIALLFVRRLRDIKRYTPNEDLATNRQEEPHVSTRAVSVIKKLLSSTFILTMILNGIINLDWLTAEAEILTHTIAVPNGVLTYTLYDDAIPLKVEDLVAEDYPYYAYKMNITESMFTKYVKCEQYAFNIYAPDFDYEIVTFKNNMFYDYCLDYYLAPYLSDENNLNVHQTNDPVWNAKKTYQVFDGTKPLGTYILCYDDMIISYNGFDILTSDQAQIVYDKLRYF